MYLYLIYRGNKISKQSTADLSVLILRDSPSPTQAFGPLVASSKRQLKSFVGCRAMLEPGQYVIVTLAFNIWTLSKNYCILKTFLYARLETGRIM